ncbi:MAG: hypothetical protein LWW86_12990 [Micrococcales bacterium]|nr:hypothetical protein [Micrococcales bacterium]
MSQNVGAGDSLTVYGGGVLRDANLSNIRVAQFDLVPRDSIGTLVRTAIPGGIAVRVGHDIPVFENCDFTGLNAKFSPWIARFINCRFAGVNIRGSLMQAHFVDCFFSGTWEANFTSESAPEDPARHVLVQGNDMRDLVGMDFFGVPLAVNRLERPGGNLVLTRADVGKQEISMLLRSHEDGRRLLDRLVRDSGNADWVLIDHTVVDEEFWRQLQFLLGPRTPNP